MKIVIAVLILLATAVQAGENPWKQRYGNGEATPPAAESSEAVAQTYQLTYGEAKEALARALEEKGAGDHLRVIYPRRDADAVASHRDPLVAEIHDLTFNAELKTWQAAFFFTAGGKPLPPVKLNGSYDEIVDVPVLKRRITHGQIIRKEDIEVRVFTVSRLRDETIYAEAELIGKSPKRTISALRPIRAEELVKPPVVHRGDKISLFYKTAAMEIKTLGEALEEGAEGDIIRIRNTDSHVVVQATVTGKGMAQVIPMDTALTTLAPTGVK